MIDFGCNDYILRVVLVHDKVGMNVITIPAIRYIGLEIERPSSIILRMANKIICKP